MRKNEFVAKVTKVLGQNDIRKKVHIDKRVLKIIDVTYKDENVTGQIAVKAKDKEVRYTNEDVSNILEAIIACIYDSIAHGEKLVISGLGTFTVKKRLGRMLKRPDNGEIVEVKDRYVPKFAFNQALKSAARIYGLSFENNPVGLESPEPMYDQFEFPDEDDLKDGEYADGSDD